jgi:Ca2+-binding RTX toxin-like protein
MGGAGNDTLIAGAGIDVLNGEGDGDTYVVGLDGAGWDVIDETAGGDTTGVDVVQFVDGILRQDVTVDVSGNDITFRSQDSKLSLTILGQYAGDDAVTRIEQFAFADGSVLTSDELKTQLLQGRDSGFDTSDTWSGNAYRNYFSGLGGNDTLAGLQGNDTLYGGVGNDSLSGGLDLAGHSWQATRSAWPHVKSWHRVERDRPYRRHCFAAHAAAILDCLIGKRPRFPQPRATAG